MNKLYQGSLDSENVGKALIELNTIEDNISKDITDLSNYFVTSDGEDFLTVFKHALEDSQESDLPIEIEALWK